MQFGTNSQWGSASDVAPSRSLPTAAQGDWIILRTRSRQEKIVASALGERGISHYFPTLLVERTYCGRPLRVEVPVFPGYVFVRCRADDVRLSGLANRISEVIEVSDQTQLNGELANVAGVLARRGQPDRNGCVPKPVHVEIRSGAFRGLRAVVANRLRRSPVVLQISTLCQAIGLDVDHSAVEPLS